MVRYELILHRRPKIGAKEVEKRLADLPNELSKGTLERALENPESVSIAIAWGGNRKRLRLIQRRIEVLGGVAELVDRGGAFAKGLTAIGDELRYFFGGKSPAAKQRKPTVVRDPTALNYIFLSVGVVAALFSLVFARGVHDVNARAYATQGAGFMLGVCLSQVFVRGVRRWFGEQGRAWVSVCMMLVPFLSLTAAGYEAYALGIVQESAATIAKRTRLAQPKPLMKPFTALLVELKHRKQREELAAALASADRAKAAEAAPVLAVDASAAGAAQATEPARPDRRAARGKRAAKRTGTQEAMTTTQTEQPATPAEATTQPVAASQSPLAAGPQAPQAAAAQHAGATQAPGRVAAQAGPAPVRKPAPPPTLQQQLEHWQPLRTVADVNEIHVGGAILLAALAFMIGVWTGRRRRFAVAAAGVAPEVVLSDAAVSAQVQPGAAVETGATGDAELQLSAAEPAAPRDWPSEAKVAAPKAEKPAEPSPLAVAQAPAAKPGADREQPPAAAAPAPKTEAAQPTAAATPEAERAKPKIDVISPVPFAIAPERPAAQPAPLAASNDNAAPAVKPLAETGTQGRKAKRREGAPGSAYSARGVQEEHVVRKRTDARRDD